MKHILTLALIIGTAPLIAPRPAEASTISRACQATNRSAATPQLCRCIQQVADQNLSKSEQRRVAKFFRDPHMAQEVRMSDRRSDEELWKRYKAFGERVSQSCS